MHLLGPNGKPLAKPSARDLQEEIAAPGVSSVRQVTAGHPADGLTPGRLSSILRAADAFDPVPLLEMVDQIERKDMHYSAVLGVRKRAVRAMELVVEPGGTDTRDEEAAAFVREQLEGAASSSILIDMLDALGKGFSLTEIIWSVSAKRWEIGALKLRDPRWFRFDQNDGQTPLLLSDRGQEEPLPPARFVYHCAKTASGIPIRGGLGYLAAWGYLFKNYAIRDWQIFMERFGQPVAIGKFPSNASVDDRRTLLRAVRNLRWDMGVAIPNSMLVEIIQNAVTGSAEHYERAARYWDEQFSKAVLGQTATTDAIAGGHAVGKVHDQVRDDIRDADAEQLASSLQSDIAHWLAQFNFGPQTATPKISFAAPEKHDPVLQLKAAPQLAALGVQISVAQMRERFGFREPQEGEAVLVVPPRQTASPPAPPEPAPEPATTASAQGRDHDHTHGDFDAFLDRFMAEGAPQAVDPMLDGFIEALEGASSLEEVRDILDSLLTQAPDATIRDLISQMRFGARLAGELGARPL